MITRDEIARSLTGAWQVFLDKPGALNQFDISYAGFWRSFQAILLIVPLYAMTVIAAYQGLATRLPEATFLDGSIYFWARFVTLGLDWITLPIILALVAGLLGFARNYSAFVVVRNWSTVLIIAPYAALSALEFAFGSLGALIVPLSILIMAAVLRFAYLVARRALDVSVGMAVSLVVLDFCLSLFINAAVNLVYGLPAAA